LGAEDDFDELYRMSRDRLVVQITAISGDSFEAMDFVQEAFIRAWSKWDKVAGYDDPEGWIRRVAYHLAIGRWRRSRKFVLRANVHRGPVELPGEQAGVIEALQRIAPSERRAIVLHHVCGLSIEETATELSAPVGTVKSWLSRGRVHLATELEDAWEMTHGTQ
jgi:RNA polymerase sigma-70 factor (ECF subfamily)